jgi:hypothetical protein
VLRANGSASSRGMPGAEAFGSFTCRRGSNRSPGGEGRSPNDAVIAHGKVWKSGDRPTGAAGWLWPCTWGPVAPPPLSLGCWYRACAADARYPEYSLTRRSQRRGSLPTVRPAEKPKNEATTCVDIPFFRVPFYRRKLVGSSEK